MGGKKKEKKKKKKEDNLLSDVFTHGLLMVNAIIVLYTFYF